MSEPKRVFRKITRTPEELFNLHDRLTYEPHAGGFMAEPQGFKVSAPLILHSTRYLSRRGSITKSLTVG